MQWEFSIIVAGFCKAVKKQLSSEMWQTRYIELEEKRDHDIFYQAVITLKQNECTFFY